VAPPPVLIFTIRKIHRKSLVLLFALSPNPLNFELRKRKFSALVKPCASRRRAAFAKWLACIVPVIALVLQETVLAKIRQATRVYC